MLLRSTYDFHTHLDARKLVAITIVAGGYGGDMPEDQAYDLLDDIDFCKPPIQRKVGWMKNIIFATVLKFT